MRGVRYCRAKRADESIRTYPELATPTYLTPSVVGVQRFCPDTSSYHYAKRSPPKGVPQGAGHNVSRASGAGARSLSMTPRLPRGALSVSPASQGQRRPGRDPDKRAEQPRRMGVECATKPRPGSPVRVAAGRAARASAGPPCGRKRATAEPVHVYRGRMECDGRCGVSKARSAATCKRGDPVRAAVGGERHASAGEPEPQRLSVWPRTGGIRAGARREPDPVRVAAGGRRASAGESEPKRLSVWPRRAPACEHGRRGPRAQWTGRAILPCSSPHPPPPPAR